MIIIMIIITITPITITIITNITDNNRPDYSMGSNTHITTSISISIY
jgi:hypothetical protein